MSAECVSALLLSGHFLPQTPTPQSTLRSPAHFAYVPYSKPMEPTSFTPKASSFPSKFIAAVPTITMALPQNKPGCWLADANQRWGFSSEAPSRLIPESVVHIQHWSEGPSTRYLDRAPWEKLEVGEDVSDGLDGHRVRSGKS
ncbi:hypothetical protein E6O75_ATG08807 [Venturia nashicola]|uniref:Uncharacterized protein n=1 Tax=Venturia nashicola TaxID=86259 RepID=A0A4Z1NV85_9PEZI|nr:hypothetical protein E6O75_ATG08807 [Venturia nashicola]